jgi:hypothetical protein
MANIISLEELAGIAQVGEIDADDWYANWICDSITVLVQAYGDPTWTNLTIPKRAKIIAILVAKRAYTNPDNEMRTQVGPIGSSVQAIDAAGMRLTDVEKAELQSIAAGTIDAPGGSIWVQPTNRGNVETGPVVAYTTTTDHPDSSWGVPYLDQDEPLIGVMTPILPE